MVRAFQIITFVLFIVSFIFSWLATMGSDEESTPKKLTNGSFLWGLLCFLSLWLL